MLILVANVIALPQLRQAGDPAESIAERAFFDDRRERHCSSATGAWVRLAVIVYKCTFADSVPIKTDHPGLASPARRAATPMHAQIRRRWGRSIQGTYQRRWTGGSPGTHGFRLAVIPVFNSLSAPLRRIGVESPAAALPQASVAEGRLCSRLQQDGSTAMVSDRLGSDWPEPTSIEVSAAKNGNGIVPGLPSEGQTFELPAQLFEQLPFAMYVCDRDGLVRRYNRRAAELWGRSPELGDPDERFCGSYRMFRPDGSPLPHHQCPMADVLRTGVSVREHEIHIERPNGLRGIALVDIEAIRDSDGGIVGAVNCFQDVTARRVAEDAALRLAAIVESSDDAIVGKDLDGIITSWNAGAERIFGYMAKEIVGKPITILIPPNYQKEEEAIIERIRRGQRIEHFETVRQRKHGSLIDLSMTISPVKNSQGKTIGASKIARDITERKRSDAQIVALAHEAEHRTKNILATVQAAVHLSHSDTSDDLKKVIEGRINALANVHTLFVESRWAGAQLQSLVTQELLPYRNGREDRVRIGGPTVMLGPNAAQAIAISLHELATNAAKYGSLSVAEGDVEIAWTLTAGGRLSLRWTESGGPKVAPPARRGFGTRVIENMIRSQTGARMRFDWCAPGLFCEIVLLLP
jgi:PAS domain S-box-containing protein